MQLVGRKTDFRGEPYALLVDGQTYRGAVAEQGYIFLPRNDPPAVSQPIMLRLCAGNETELVIGIESWRSSATAGRLQTLPAADCGASTLAAYLKENGRINHGMPLVFAEWSQGQSPMEAAAKKQQEKEAVLADYRRIAAANADSLFWLGPMPVDWDVEAQAQRLHAVVERMTAEVTRLSDDDLKHFHCRRPEEVGPTPDMTAVNRFIESYPGSPADALLLRDVEGAARKGNWLAAAQLYALMSQGQMGGNVYATRYRYLQLAEWLQQRKIGAIYDVYGYQLDASGYNSDAPNYAPNSFTVYAALHDSYPAQFDVGQYLQQGDRRADLQAVGRAMVKCARAALPAYAKKFK